MSLVVLQVFFFYVEEKLSIESSKMASYERIRTVFVVFLGYGREWTRVSNWIPDAQKVWIDEPGLITMKDSIEEFKDLPA